MTLNPNGGSSSDRPSCVGQWSGQDAFADSRIFLSDHPPINPIAFFSILLMALRSRPQRIWYFCYAQPDWKKRPCNGYRQ
ncbi:MAG TPA: hypothetical protein IGS37_16985 [Synechococcales cyanobacterium M55_K2018_004]|nr:hypothetical protein [Synechococcales cyanobacterium M55_K2018_004]